MRQTLIAQSNSCLVNEIAIRVQLLRVHGLALGQVCAELCVVIHLGLVLSIGKAGGKLKNTGSSAIIVECRTGTRKRLTSYEVSL